jgi:hypothetical protein
MGMGHAGSLEVGLEGVARRAAVVKRHIHRRHAAPAAADHGGQQGSLQTG